MLWLFDDSVFLCINNQLSFDFVEFVITYNLSVFFTYPNIPFFRKIKISIKTYCT